MALKRFIVTYVQEVTQGVQAENLGDAGAYAKDYVAQRKGLKVLYVYPATPDPLTPPPAAA